MMKQLVEYTTADGKKLYVEAEVLEQAPVAEQALPPLPHLPGPFVPTPSGPIVPAADQIEVQLEQVLDAIGPAVVKINEKFKSLQPKSMDLQFSLDLKISAGPIWILTGSADANFQIKLHWGEEGKEDK